MSVTKTFDDWYEKLSSTEQSEILGHVLNNKCELACEGFHSGPHGVVTEGLFVASSGNTAQSKCALCGK